MEKGSEIRGQQNCAVWLIWSDCKWLTLVVSKLYAIWTVHANSLCSHHQCSALKACFCRFCGANCSSHRHTFSFCPFALHSCVWHRGQWQILATHKRQKLCWQCSISGEHTHRKHLNLTEFAVWSRPGERWLELMFVLK